MEDVRRLQGCCFVRDDGGADGGGDGGRVKRARRRGDGDGELRGDCDCESNIISE